MKNKLELLKLKLQLKYAQSQKRKEWFKLQDSPDRGGYTHSDASYDRYHEWKSRCSSLEKEIEENSSKKR